MLKIDWAGYKEYLKRTCIENTVKDRYNYSIKHQKYLLNLNTISDLMTFSPDKRLHIMKALSSLSKFLGYSDVWQQAIKRHKIRWSTGNNSLVVFDKIVNQTNYSGMLEWIKKAISVLPESDANLILFHTLVGLRPNESFKAIHILHNNLDAYWNKDKDILEHYKFPSEFIRRTKNVYISVVNQSIVNIALRCSTKTNYNSLKLSLKRRNIEMNMYYCRKVFATYLRNKGIEPEIIDLLQGRISSSVFVNHYYRPDINEIITRRIRPVLDELRKELQN
jgi:intergrase/recombinase